MSKTYIAYCPQTEEQLLSTSFKTVYNAALYALRCGVNVADGTTPRFDFYKSDIDIDDIHYNDVFSAKCFSSLYLESIEDHIAYLTLYRFGNVLKDGSAASVMLNSFTAKEAI